MDIFKKYCVKFFFFSFFLLLFLAGYRQLLKPSDMAWIPGGDFIMGSNSSMANRNEQPAHKVHVNGFWMDKTDVTNAQFALFVEGTGYVTTAEQKPDWETIKAQGFCCENINVHRANLFWAQLCSEPIELFKNSLSV
ncbi:SUMF1/EgtB/PvdO family nonheme iron enzyme [Legionella cincinnatiensis]|uniref:Serine/threonine-protein kinase pkn1 n=1 Tax=Legionella cincinnatiensis TaxID=28085 RepID=A0A378IM10_9GAMM|nr:SUMF1/EgtB/PvdO family nonheme iron enzyme [Legionella cincinnatiensis]KTC89290.1 Serine/threonine-protein kinase pkn1 [Legionella cincinnatiensis]STX36287.1 Serine/threonine-protein kinase pkn1 [Legionella cincinnatiensis]